MIWYDPDGRQRTAPSFPCAFFLFSSWLFIWKGQASNWWSLGGRKLVPITSNNMYI